MLGTARRAALHCPAPLQPPTHPAPCRTLPAPLQAKRQFQFQREWHYEAVMDAAFESHHYQMENSVNGFATINRLAGVLTQVRGACCWAAGMLGGRRAGGRAGGLAGWLEPGLQGRGCG